MMQPGSLDGSSPQVYRDGFLVVQESKNVRLGIHLSKRTDNVLTTPAYKKPVVDDCDSHALVNLRMVVIK